MGTFGKKECSLRTLGYFRRGAFKLTPIIFLRWSAQIHLSWASHMGSSPLVSNSWGLLATRNIIRYKFLGPAYARLQKYFHRMKILLLVEKYQYVKIMDISSPPAPLVVENSTD